MTLIEGVDVSRYQNPNAFDWPALAKRMRFLFARATYGQSLDDANFLPFAEKARASGLAFGAYLFFRQIHDPDKQLAAFYKQLERIGELQPGDCFPILDMENNQKYDGYPISTKMSYGCQSIAEELRERYGGCILYYSSYFPEYLKGLDGWRQEDGYYHWLADYGTNTKPSVPGKPRTPYTQTWHIHQARARKIPEYAQGQHEIDYNVVNPAADFGELAIADPNDVSDEAKECEADTSGRPGGALDDDETHARAMTLIYDGAKSVLKGAELLEAKK